jgi:formylglycine-generating enzyme required for sulfatase activity
MGDYRQTPQHPVANVAWTDALAFCEWLGAGHRLPCESEWEYACRAGRYGLWHHGDEPANLRAFAVFGVNVSAAVGTRKPNDWGLFDMLGNAAEMCEPEDRWTDDPHMPMPSGAGVHPVRGGRFNEQSPDHADTFPTAYRCARRRWEPRSSLLAGFRVLRELPPQS